MPTSWHLSEKSRKVCINTRSPPALLVFIHVGQATLPTTVKCPTETKLLLECILHQQSDVIRSILANHCDWLSLLAKTCFEGYMPVQAVVVWKLDNTVMYFNV